LDGYAPKPNYIVKSALGMELIWCPPGSFIMGPGQDDECPAHPVILTKGFYLGKYEVSQQQYKKVMGNNPSKFTGDKLPVENVSWNDAVAFCQALTSKERKRGWEFTLPTEAQWEYACRADTTTLFSWGNQVSSQFANCQESGLGRTMDVGSYPPNLWGFYDMHGNAREWTADWYSAYPNQPVVDPLGPKEGSNRTFRGGSYNVPVAILRSAYRSLGSPSYRGSGIGFRLCFQQQ